MALTAWPLLGCGTGSGSAPLSKPDAAPAAPIVVEAGFVDVPARQVHVKGQPVTIEATARLFYNLRPADEAPGDKPIFILSNGFAAEIVRAYGTGPTTVVEGGSVVPNASSLTRAANLVYVEPRQSGYSYDVVSGRSPNAADCAPSIFNEYVDAADALWGALAVLESHPQLAGPVYWLGESYAGVRVTWLLAYLRGRWDLANYSDPALAAKIGALASARATSLTAGQVLLEPWLAGGPHGAAIQAACSDPTEIATVAAAVGMPCNMTDACVCATMHDRSAYNVDYTNERQDERDLEASAAHTQPDRAAALLGVPLTSIDGLAADARSQGFKCSAPDSTVPDEAALVALLGALPSGQSYYVPYSPLLPGKETRPTTLDWRTQPDEGQAFVDNLHDVPTFITDGAFDLVVPERALAPALGAIVGMDRIDVRDPSRLGVLYPDGERFATLGHYPTAGHMITMLASAPWAADVEAWLALR